MPRGLGYFVSPTGPSPDKRAISFEILDDDNVRAFGQVA